MNGRFNGFPSTEGQRIIDIVEFDSSGSYAIPNETVFLYVFAVSGGGGGSAGAVQPSAPRGGNAGQGGTIFYDILYAPSIGPAGTILNITIPAGGGGSVNSATGSTNSTAGSDGGALEIKVDGLPGYLIKLQGGLGGNPTSLSTARTTYTGIFFRHRTNKTQTSGVGGLPTPTDVVVLGHTDCCGAGGGGVSSPTPSAGASIRYGGFNQNSIMNPNLQLKADINSGLSYTGVGITAAPGAAINTAAANSSFHIFDRFSPGLGGAGGGGSTGAFAGAGGNGYRGSGGGGGGACLNGFSPAKGGDGGNGYVAIMAIR
jgi:hypothetical protein